MTSSWGYPSDHYYFNSYGQLHTKYGYTLNPYRFGAKYGYYTDLNTGFVLAGQRWYSPAIMRWLSRDPIGYEGGDNLYEYVDSNPVRYVDPDGTQIAETAVGIELIAPGVVAIICYLDPKGCEESLKRMNRCDDYNPNMLSNSESSATPVPGGHTKGSRPSTKQKHEKGDERRKRDKKGGEKGDARRPY